MALCVGAFTKRPRPLHRFHKHNTPLLRSHRDEAHVNFSEECFDPPSDVVPSPLGVDADGEMLRLFTSTRRENLI